MAEVTRVHGTAAGVSNVDIAETGAASINQTISVVGRGLTFYKVTLAADNTAQFGTGGTIEAILRTIQVKASTVAYCLATGGLILSVAVDATGWTDGDLQTAIQGLGTVNGVVLGATTAATAAFKLA
jgi:hypothetical protein